MGDLEAEIREAAADTQKVKLLIRLAEKLGDTGQTTLAGEKLTEAGKLADLLNYDYGFQLIYLQQAYLFLLKRQPDSARKVIENALQQYPVSRLAAKYYNYLATAYRFKGEDQKALSFYTKAIALSDTVNDVNTVASVRQNMAVVYSRMGENDKALEQYLKGLEYAEASRDTMFLATLLNNLGRVYTDQDQAEKADYYLQRSLDLSRSIHFKIGLLRASLNLGIVKSSLEEFDKALVLFRQALKLSAETRPGVPPVQITHNMGQTYYKMGDLKEAEKFFNKSLQQSEAMNVMQGIYYNTNGLGSIAAERQNYDEAIAWHKRALAAAQQLGTPILLEEAQKKLYELNKTRGKYQAALGHLEAYTGIADSLEKIQNERTLAEYETKLNVRRQQEVNAVLQEKQKVQEAKLNTQRWLILAGLLVIILICVIVLLLVRKNREERQVNKILNDQKRELERVNQIKNKLFAIIAHDLRSPLAGVKGLLYLFREDDLSKDEMQDLAAQLEISIEQNMNIMENLLIWAREQMEGITLNSNSLKIKPVIDEILNSFKLHAQQKNIKLINEASDEISVLADEDMIKLVLRNLVSNSIKFSKPGGMVTVRSADAGDSATITVEDTGIGIPESLKDSIFNTEIKSRRGTNDETGSGLGLSLCKEFIEKQHGSLFFESEEGKVTAFHFSLPVPEYVSLAK